MLIDPTRLHGIYLVCGRTDLRRGIVGLAAVVQEQYQLNPHNQSLYLFCGRRKDRCKALFWDGDGFILLYKRVENGHIQWPTNQNEVKKLHTKKLVRLLSGWAIESSIKPIRPPRNNHGQTR